MNVYYRVSDNSYCKNKIGATKFRCLKNFLQTFNDDLLVIADNCHLSTIEFLESNNIKFEITSLGNSGSFRYALNKAIDLKDETKIYFVEDDYWHLNGSSELIAEGLQVADYVTLYDHPDKYSQFYNFGEITKVIKTTSSHWKQTISTCMTFATTVKILKVDYDIFNKWTADFHPHDHYLFSELKEIGRKLISPLPGKACHMDLTLSEELGYCTIEPWAIQKMLEFFKDDPVFDMMSGKFSDIQLLMYLQNKNGEN